ncbi:MAG TPA: tetratricopeptide repeat protein, partial [Polyangiaceae bacterium]
MSVDPQLDHLSREELVERARALGARRPEVMTRVELRDEIVRLSESDPIVRRRARGWLGVARDLVASVVDTGLNLPGAAAAIRGEAKPENDWRGPPPVATLTLAEIYLAQGHVERALAVVNEVLASEPDHAAAHALRDRLTQPHSARRRPEPELPPEPEPTLAPAPDLEPTPAPTPGPESTQAPAPTPGPESTQAPAPAPEPFVTLIAP